MKYNLTNESHIDTNEIEPILDKFIPYAQQKMGFNRPPNLFLTSDEANALDPLGKTAYFNPENDQIVIYTDNRHIKDVLRSIGHELVHFTQRCNGELGDASGAAEDGYAQKDSHLRDMEKQAYQTGNMVFRDFEDNYKKQREGVMEESKKGKTHDPYEHEGWYEDKKKDRAKELYDLMLNKFGLKTKKKTLKD
jgi:hypothetical protein